MTANRKEGPSHKGGIRMDPLCLRADQSRRNQCNTRQTPEINIYSYALGLQEMRSPRFQREIEKDLWFSQMGHRFLTMIRWSFTISGHALWHGQSTKPERKNMSDKQSLRERARMDEERMKVQLENLTVVARQQAEHADELYIMLNNRLKHWDKILQECKRDEASEACPQVAQVIQIQIDCAHGMKSLLQRWVDKLTSTYFKNKKDEIPF